MSSQTVSQCPYCEGKGHVYGEHEWSDGVGGVERTCPLCNGKGLLTLSLMDMVLLYKERAGGRGGWGTAGAADPRSPVPRDERGSGAGAAVGGCPASEPVPADVAALPEGGGSEGAAAGPLRGEGSWC
jgi:hypothetical protein